MHRIHPGPSARSVLRAAAVAGLTAAVVAGCATAPPMADGKGVDDAPSAVEAPLTEFTVPADMLDTWNAVGQILVRAEGVTYESRAQMLGLYAVQYRGERVLVLTRAQVMQAAGDGVLTRVYAAGPNGSQSTSPAASELLSILRQRLPEELALIAAGGRGAVKSPTPATTSKTR